MKNQKKSSLANIDSNLAVDLANKKIQILEHEIKKLKATSPRLSGTDRLVIESSVNNLKEEIKSIANTNKELERKIADLQKNLPELDRELFNKKLAELRTIREKIKHKEEKYSHEQKIHDQNLEEINKLQEQVKKMNENHLDYLKIESKTENYYSYDIEEIQRILLGLEQDKRYIELQGKQEAEKLLIEIKEYQDKNEILKKELKLKTHDTKIQDYEINNLKRKFRSVSANRFGLLPNFEADSVEFKDDSNVHDVIIVNKLATVKSESRIPSAYKKPPRVDTSSPAAQRIKQLKQELKKAQKEAGLVKKPEKMSKLLKTNKK